MQTREIPKVPLCVYFGRSFLKTFIKNIGVRVMRFKYDDYKRQKAKSEKHLLPLKIFKKVERVRMEKKKNNEKERKKQCLMKNNSSNRLRGIFTTFSSFSLLFLFNFFSFFFFFTFVLFLQFIYYCYYFVDVSFREFYGRKFDFFFSGY